MSRVKKVRERRTIHACDFGERRLGDWQRQQGFHRLLLALQPAAWAPARAACVRRDRRVRALSAQRPNTVPITGVCRACVPVRRRPALRAHTRIWRVTTGAMRGRIAPTERPSRRNSLPRRVAPGGPGGPATALLAVPWATGERPPGVRAPPRRRCAPRGQTPQEPGVASWCRGWLARRADRPGASYHPSVWTERACRHKAPRAGRRQARSFLHASRGARRRCPSTRRGRGRSRVSPRPNGPGALGFPRSLWRRSASHAFRALRLLWSVCRPPGHPTTASEPPCLRHFCPTKIIFVLN